MNRKKTLIFLFFICFSFLVVGFNSVEAQKIKDVYLEDLSEKELEDFYNEVSKDPVLSTLKQTAVENNNEISCFDYYKFNSVQVSIEPTVTNVVPGSSMTFLGTIKNENPYPIIEGSVYVKIFKLRNDETLQDKNANGPFVVDQFFAIKDVYILGNEQKNISFDWDIPTWAESGEYQIATFFVSKDRYNLLGLSFTDDVVGNTSRFGIKFGVSGIVSLDKDTVKLNGNDYTFAAFPPRFKKTEPINLDLNILNTTDKIQKAKVTFNLYSWDAMSPDTNLISTISRNIDVSPNQKNPIPFQITDTEHPVYLIETVLEYEDTKSILNVRLVRSGINKLRINFPSTFTYPIIAGQEATIFSCLHNMSDSLEDGRLLLTLLNDKGEQVHSYEYKGKVGGSMMGIVSRFIPKKSMDTFSIRAELFQNDNLVDDVTMKYSCIDFESCKKNNFNIWIVYIGFAILLVVLILGLILNKINKKKKYEEY